MSWGPIGLLPLRAPIEASARPRGGRAPPRAARARRTSGRSAASRTPARPAPAVPRSRQQRRASPLPRQRPAAPLPRQRASPPRQRPASPPRQRAWLAPQQPVFRLLCRSLRLGGSLRLLGSGPPRLLLGGELWPRLRFLSVDHVALDEALPILGETLVLARGQAFPRLCGHATSVTGKTALRQSGRPGFGWTRLFAPTPG